MELAEFYSLFPPDLAAVARRPGETDDNMLYPAERDLLRFEPAPAQFAAAPAWPPGLRGSIAHKERLAIAAVGRSESVAGVGIDVEETRALPASVWSRVLTSGEQDRLRANRSTAGWKARLIFAAKEAYYKWLRSSGRDDDVGFLDVEVDLDGSRLRYRSGTGAILPVPEGRFVAGPEWLLTAAWSVTEISAACHSPW